MTCDIWTPVALLVYGVLTVATGAVGVLIGLATDQPCPVCQDIEASGP